VELLSSGTAPNQHHCVLQRQSYDSKLTDPFYDSLEGLLMDLKTITIVCHASLIVGTRLRGISNIGQPRCGGFPQTSLQSGGTGLL
jgi:hypothetical protein